MTFDFSLTERVEQWRDPIAGFIDGLLGPLALNCSAPYEGNIHMLHMIATQAQRQRYLLPRQ